MFPGQTARAASTAIAPVGPRSRLIVCTFMFGVTRPAEWSAGKVKSISAHRVGGQVGVAARPVGVVRLGDRREATR
jgi:hypothetical protein